MLTTNLDFIAEKRPFLLGQLEDIARGIVIASRYYEQGGVTTAGAAAREGEPGPTRQEEQSTESIASEARKEPEDV